MTMPDRSWTVDAHDIDLGPILMSVATNAGPRILSLRRPGGPEFLAALPDSGIDHPESGFLRFLGGHRLWRSPEIPMITYQPDDFDVVLTESDNGIDLAGRPDTEGVIKHISIHQEDEYTVVRHRLTNGSAKTIRTAPWAITQMAPGGTAVLPQRNEPIDEFGVLPNRNLVLWPYTDLTAPEFGFGLDRVTVESSQSPSRAKIGQPNRRGWMAYILEGQIFVKWAAVHDDDAAYTDFGASSQCYRDARFLELETVGPIAELAPDQGTTHTEVWRIMEIGDRSLELLLDALPERPGGDAL